MAGVSIRIEIEDAEASAMLARLRALASGGYNLRPMYASIGESMLNSTRQRFEDGKDPEGQPWLPLSAATLKRKKKNRDRILVESGDLHGLLSYHATNGGVVVGSDRPYAAIHQLGGQAGRKSARVTIPARPFLGISRGGWTEVHEILEEEILRAIRQ